MFPLRIAAENQRTRERRELEERVSVRRALLGQKMEEESNQFLQVIMKLESRWQPYFNKTSSLDFLFRIHKRLGLKKRGLQPS